jgi:hypothetical protein
MTTYRVRLTDDWLPLPEALLRALGWREGDQISIEVIDDTLVITRVGPPVQPQWSSTPPAPQRYR